MVRGRWQDAPAPFRFRVLVPWLASWLPMEPLSALRLLTYLSLFGLYCVLWLTGIALGISSVASGVGVFVAYASIWHLYHFHNPFLVDATGLFVLTVLLYAFVTNRFWWFFVVALLGSLVRETSLFLVMLWCVRDLRKGAVVSVLALFVFWMPRFWLGQPSDTMGLLSAFSMFGIPRLKSPVSSLFSIFLTWGALWLILGAGLWLYEREMRRNLGLIVGLLGLGAMVTNLLANDTGRMFVVLLPVVALGAAKLFHELAPRYKYWILGWLGFVVGKLFCSFPNVVFSRESWVFASRVPRMVWLGSELLLTMVLVFLVYRVVLSRNNLHQISKQARPNNGYAASIRP